MPEQQFEPLDYPLAFPADREFLRHALHTLAAIAPGKSVEVRVVPLAAVQVIPGVRHTRGTPPNVIEMTAETWHSLLSGCLTWTQGTASGLISASGNKADLTELLPQLQRALLTERSSNPPHNRIRSIP